MAFWTNTNPVFADPSWLGIPKSETAAWVLAISVVPVKRLAIVVRKCFPVLESVPVSSAFEGYKPTFVTACLNTAKLLVSATWSFVTYFSR